MRGDEVADDFGAELARNLGIDLPLARATKEQYDRMIAENLGDLAKSGIAELIFKDRRSRVIRSAQSSLLVQPNLKRKKGAFCFKAFKFEFAKRIYRNQFS